MEPQYESAKRKRLPLACNVCRRKKIKCDGVRPTCGKCAHYRQECKYSDVVKKRGPRQGHIDVLEERLRKMEELITTGTSVLEASPSTLPIIEEAASQSEPRPMTFISKANSNFSSLPPATSPSIATSSASGSGSGSASATTPSWMLQKSTPIDKVEGLPMYIIQHLVDIYFLHFEALSPIADVKGFKEIVINRKCNTFLLYAILSVAARFSKRVDIAQQPPWMAGEKFAEIARSMLNQVIEEPSTEHLQGLLILSLNEFGCARTRRCWMYSGIAIRMMLELGIEKELMLEEISGSILPVNRWLWYENRRKIYWNTFLQDKLNSAITGKPQVLNYRESNVLLPIYNSLLNLEYSGEFYQRNLEGTKIIRYNVHRNPLGQVTGIQMTHVDSSPVDTYAHVFNQVGLESRIAELVVLLGRITRFVNTGIKDVICLDNNVEFEQLNQDLDSWESRLPHQLRNTHTNLEYYRQVYSFQTGQFALAHIMHNALVVLLNRPTLVLADMPKLDQVTRAMQEKIRQSKEKCLAAAENVTVILKDVLLYVDMMPPCTIYFAYAIATVLANNSFGVDAVESKKCEAALQEYYRFFEGMKAYWVMSDKMSFLVKDLYAIHMKVIDTVKKNQLASISGGSSGGDGTISSFESSTNSNTATSWDATTNSISTGGLPQAGMTETTAGSSWDDRSLHFPAKVFDRTPEHGLPFYSFDKKALSGGISSFDLWLQQQQDQKHAQL